MQAGGGKAVDPNAVKENRLTCTNKDLRRLSMVESKNLLLKLGLTEDEIKGLRCSKSSRLVFNIRSKTHISRDISCKKSRRPPGQGILRRESGSSVDVDTVL